MDSDLHPEAILVFLDELSASAGKIIMSYFRGEFRVDSKDARPGGIDIVTDADRASEELILKTIRSRFPDHDILTEERRTESTGSALLWLVDPLDGTVNFSHGYPMFAVSIALMQDNELLCGMVHDPVHGESFSAFRGQGAFLNGNPIRVSTANRLERSIVATGFPYDKAYSEVNNIAEFTNVVKRVQGIRREGSAALDLAFVACGRLDGFWELKLKPWDMAAGMLLVSEAGGLITDRSGSPTDVYTSSIVATNGIIHHRLTELLSKGS
ncbi:MAG TPA: inositol monophosphatase family protein [Desulfomonilaceae bacterium]|nr:inositol monophosphatase family protein [Desulfomonilaceae bacterium]